jgi:hypothetical protein
VRRLLVVCLLPALIAIGLGCGDEEGGTSTQASSDILGHWSGTLHQSSLAPFKVTATIGALEDPAANRVSYTGINCGGNWHYLGRKAETFRFREVINHGKGGDCKGVGIVTLHPVSADRLDYVFRGGGVESRGVLTRDPSG